MTKKQRLTAAFFAVIILLGGVLAALIQNGTINAVSLFGICSFEQSRNIPCPFCGMTRSVCLFAAGDIIGSYKMQPAGGFLSTVAAIMFIYFTIRALGFPLTRLTNRLRLIRPLDVVIVVAAIILAGWLITMSKY
jgi:hypothetical protein